jgi:hypothetical protein
MIRRDYHRYKVNEIGMTRGASVVILDVSCRGMRIVSSSALSVGDRLTVEFGVPALLESGAVKEGRVAWCRQLPDGTWECGLDFGMDNRLKFPF